MTAVVEIRAMVPEEDRTTRGCLTQKEYDDHDDR
jgi:hypothetical protein